MQKLACPRSGVWALTFSPDGDMLAGIGREALYCWTRSQGWEQSGLKQPGIQSVTFHTEGHTLAYCGSLPRPSERLRNVAEQARAIRFHSLTPVRQIEPEFLPNEPLDAPDISINPWHQQLTFTPDGQILLANIFENRGWFRGNRSAILHWHLTSSGDRWRVVNPTPTRTETACGGAMVGNSYLALAGSWGLQICPLAPTTAPLFVPDVTNVQQVVTAQCQELVAVVADQRVRVWQLRENNPVATWPTASQGAPTLAFSPDGRILAAGETDGTVCFRDPLTGGRGSTFDFGVGAVYSLAYAPDGLTLAVAGRTGLVVVDVD